MDEILPRNNVLPCMAVLCHQVHAVTAMLPHLAQVRLVLREVCQRRLRRTLPAASSSLGSPTLGS